MSHEEPRRGAIVTIRVGRMNRDNGVVNFFRLRPLLARLGEYPTWAITALSAGLIATVSVADYFTGHGVSLAIFYLLPIGLAAHFGSRTLGMVVSLAAAFAWLAADQARGGPATLGLVPAWNAVTRLALFVTVVHLVATLREQLQAEALRSITDPLTGIRNRRGFYEAAERELQRLTRYGHPVSIAFIDLDGFKQVNDRLGHRAGDELLGRVAATIRDRLRDTDVTARIGGDEFAVLLGEADYPAADKAVAILQRRLADEMTRCGWPVTFSIGVVTCDNAPPSVDELLSAADHLMYAVKNDGKNAAIHQRWQQVRAAG